MNGLKRKYSRLRMCGSINGKNYISSSFFFFFKNNRKNNNYTTTTKI